MKRIISLFMVICICVSTLNVTVFGEEDIFINLRVMDGSENGSVYSVVVDNNTLLFSVEDLAKISGFSYEIVDDSIIFTRGMKTVKIDISSKTYRVLDDSVAYGLSKMRKIGATYYISGSEFLPWLNVKAGSTQNDGEIYVIQDAISYWDFAAEFNEKKDSLLFDMEACCKEMGIESKWLIGATLEATMSHSFMDFIGLPLTEYSLESHLEYMDFFENMIEDGTRVESAYEQLFKNNEKIKKGFDIIKMLDGLEDMPDEVKILEAASKSFSIMNDVYSYAIFLQVLQEDNSERLMWLDNMNTYGGDYYPYNIRFAAYEVENLYKGDVDSFLTKFWYSALDDVVGGMEDVLKDMILGAGIVRGAVEVIGLYSVSDPEWETGVSNMGKYNAICQGALELYNAKYGKTTIADIETQRAQANILLYATEYNWRVMADYARYIGNAELSEKYTQKAEEALVWQGVFLASALSMENDSCQYGAAMNKATYQGKIRNVFSDIIEKTVISGDEKETTITPETTKGLTEEEARQIVAEKVERFITYDNIGLYCDITYDISADEYNGLMAQYKELGEFPYDIYKIECCKSVEDINSHLYEYLSEELVNKYGLCSGEQIYEYNGNLYFVEGPKGYVSYDYEDFTISEYSNDKIVVLCDYLNSGGEKIGKYEFVFKKMDEKFVITKIVEKIGE